MSLFRFPLLSLAALCLLLPPPAAAHKLSVLAWPAGSEIQGEVSSSDGGPDDGRNVKIIVQNAATHAILLETKTDDKGEFRFALPARAKQEQADILLIADAGQGHRGEQLLPAAEQPDAGVPAAAALSGGGGDEQLRRIVAEEVNRALFPVRRTLAQMQEHQPDFRDILGGIGWIFGLAGLLAWFRSRKGMK